MTNSNNLTIPYARHSRVERLRDVLQYHVESIALGFDRWGEARVHGPGLYLAIVVGPKIADYADPMGNNRWPTERSRDALSHSDDFANALKDVAYTADGAVVVSVDGIVSDQLVRFNSLGSTADLEYAPWMGSRHMSALDISTRPDVVTTMTLSQESGRVTRFENGTFESVEFENLGEPYRAE